MPNAGERPTTHDGFKRNVSLSIRQMEFRFNQRNDPGRLDYLKCSLIGP